MFNLAVNQKPPDNAWRMSTVRFKQEVFHLRVESELPEHRCSCSGIACNSS
jgi:hypothetical protein